MKQFEVPYNFNMSAPEEIDSRAVTDYDHHDRGDDCHQEDSQLVQHSHANIVQFSKIITVSSGDNDLAALDGQHHSIVISDANEDAILTNSGQYIIGNQICQVVPSHSYSVCTGDGEVSHVHTVIANHDVDIEDEQQIIESEEILMEGEIIEEVSTENEQDGTTMSVIIQGSDNENIKIEDESSEQVQRFIDQAVLDAQLQPECTPEAKAIKSEEDLNKSVRTAIKSSMINEIRLVTEDYVVVIAEKSTTFEKSLNDQFELDPKIISLLHFFPSIKMHCLYVYDIKSGEEIFCDTINDQLIKKGVDQFQTNNNMICKKSFTSLEELLSHKKVCQQACASVRVYECDVCNKTFSKALSLDRHRAVHSRKNLNPSRKLRKNKENIDSNIKKIKTEPLTESEKKKESKHSMLSSVDTARGPNCSICSKKLTNMQSLRRHIRTHTGEKPYHCIYCKKCFSDNSALRKHKRIHTGDKPYSCEVCGRSFTQLEVMKRHLKVHMENRERPYKCKVCHKSFLEARTLSFHELRHMSPDEPSLKKHMCPVCDKVFGITTDLKRHILIHSAPGTRPFACTCDICGKSFYYSSSLSKHMRIHTGEKPFECKVCRKRFNRKGNLKKHERTHSGERPYTCKICCKSFTESSTLRKHEKTHMVVDSNYSITVNSGSSQLVSIPVIEVHEGPDGSYESREVRTIQVANGEIPLSDVDELSQVTSAEEIVTHGHPIVIQTGIGVEHVSVQEEVHGFSSVDATTHQVVQAVALHEEISQQTETVQTDDSMHHQIVVEALEQHQAQQSSLQNINDMLAYTS